MAEALPPSSSSNYGNSHKKKGEKNIQKVVVGEVVQRKKGMGRKFVELFGGDDAKTVGQFLMQDVFVPALKNFISDFVGQGVDRFLFGGSVQSSRGRVLSNGRHVATDYQSMYKGGRSGRRDGEDRYLQANAGPHSDFRDLVFPSRGDAEQVLDNMIMTIQEYDVVTLSDLYTMIGKVPEFTDNKFGWSELEGSRIHRASGGWALVLPRLTDIDN